MMQYYTTEVNLKTPLQSMLNQKNMDLKTPNKKIFENVTNKRFLKYPHSALTLSILMCMSPCGAEDVVTFEDTIVTAEHVEKSLLESSTSIALVDETSLESKNLTNLTDVYEQTTNMTPIYGTGKAPTVRGVDGTGPAENANAFFAGSRPRLSIQVDKRVSSYNEVVFGNLGLFDVEQVEVLRGAQSSLVGRNAIAGSVVVKTNDPMFEKQAKARIAVGSQNQKNIASMLNLPISDTTAMRFVADWQKRQSVVDYDSFEGVADPDKIESLNLRGKLLYQPSDKKKLLINLNHNKHSAPNGEIVARPFDKRRSNFPAQPRHEPRTNSASIDYTQQINEHWKLAINASATDFNFKRTAQPNTSSAEIKAKRYEVEPQLHYKTEQGTKAVAGLYYHKNNQDEFVAFLGGQNFNDQSDTYAVYAEGVMPMTNQLSLVLGARYEKEDRQRNGGDATRKKVNISADKTYQAFLPKLGINWQPNTNMNWGASVSKGYNAGGGGITFDVFPIVNYEYDQESVWTYELFGRQQLANKRIQTTQNLFYSEYTDMQLPFDLTPNNSRDEAFVVRNADKVSVKGLELGINARLTNSLSTWGNLALLDTKVEKYPKAGIEGNQLFTAPKVTADVGLSWQQGNWDSNLSAHFTDKYFTGINNRDKGQTSPYVITNANLAYQFEQVRVFGGIKNLFDTNKPIARYPGLTPPKATGPDSKFDTAVFLQPRSFVAGLEFTY